MKCNLLDDPAFGNLRLAGRLQAELDSFKNIRARLFQLAPCLDFAAHPGPFPGISGTILHAAYAAARLHWKVIWRDGTRLGSKT